MKTLPILFSTPMVNAIIQNRKTQTRREIKHFGNSYHYDILLCDWGLSGNPKHIDGVNWEWTLQTEVDANRSFRLKCPYGKPSDILWVKELHYRYGHWNKNGITKTGKQKWIFIPDKQFNEIRYSENPPDKVEKNSFHGTGWYKRNSLFMPREAARLFLEVTNLRVERLQDISEQDASAEGAQDYYGENAPYHTNKIRYKDLWNEINGKGSWDKNPFVWVIEFKQIAK